jgi:hypothetical protein
LITNVSRQSWKLSNSKLKVIWIIKPLDGEMHKLRGLYNLTSKRCVIPMDIFEKEETKRQANSNTITIRTSA